MKNPSFDLLIDSDAFVGWIFPNDPHFPAMQAAFQAIFTDRLRIACTNTVRFETATVLSHRQDQSLACTFLEQLERIQLPIIRISESLEKKALTLFKQQTQRGSSFIDCANVVALQEYGIPSILSFDKAYSKQYGVEQFDLDGF